MTLAERARTVAILAATALVVNAPAAGAQSADAEALFREGRRLIKAGKVAAGCDKLEASEHVESSVGTLLNLGDCRDTLGMTASAWAAFRKAEAMAKRSGDAARQGEAARRAAQIEPRLLTLVIQVDRGVDGLVVRRDDEALEPAAWNTPIPVDPGTYTISAEAPGYLPWKTSVPIDVKLRRRAVAVPVLERAPVAAPAAGPAAVGEGAGGTAATPAARTGSMDAASAAIVDPRTGAPLAIRGSASTWSGPRKVAVGLALVGSGAVGIGVYYGLRSRELADQADARCPDATCGDSAALRLNDRARTEATKANILYAAGGGAIAVAAVLWLVGKPDDPNETTVVPTVGATHAGVSLARRF